jgi:hypothetical protein
LGDTVRILDSEGRRFTYADYKAWEPEEGERFLFFAFSLPLGIFRAVQLFSDSLGLFPRGLYTPR